MVSWSNEQLDLKRVLAYAKPGRPRTRVRVANASQGGIDLMNKLAKS